MRERAVDSRDEMEVEGQTRNGQSANSAGILWMVGLGIIVLGILMAFCTVVTDQSKNVNSVNRSPSPIAGP